MEKFSFEAKLLELHGEDVSSRLRGLARTLDAVADLPEGRTHVHHILVAWGYPTPGSTARYSRGEWGLFLAAARFVDGEEL